MQTDLRTERADEVKLTRLGHRPRWPVLPCRSMAGFEPSTEDAASPLFSELRNIVLKTVGLAEPLRDSLRPLSAAIRAAFVYGSLAKAIDQSASDIDLMIISDSLTYGEVFGALERVTRAVGRKVNPTV